MTTTYTGLKTIIINKLKALTIGEDLAFVDVYGVNPTEPAGYPYAIVIENVGEGEIIDTDRNERILEFKVRLYQEVGNKTPTQAAATRLSITDAVMEMFDEDPQLTVDDEYSVMKVNVTPISFEEITKDRAIFVSEFIVQCVVLVNNF
jgi:hypothetical protein